MLFRGLLGVSVLVWLLAGPAVGQQAATPAFEVPTLIAPGQGLPRDVITLRELLEHRVALAPRLLADHLDFPLMVRPMDEVIERRLGAPACAYYGQGFDALLVRPWCEPEAHPVFDACKRELQNQQIDQGRTDDRIRIAFLTFMTNYPRLRQLVRLCPGEAAGRAFMLQRLAELYDAGTLVLNFKQATLNGLSRLEELDQVPAGLPADVTCEFDTLVAHAEDLREEDIQRYLPIRNEARFRRQCLAHTAQLLDDDAGEAEALAWLQRMTPAEAIAAGAYFARSRIQAYAAPEDQKESLELDDMEDVQDALFHLRPLQVGDCRHFAGLAVHYLNHVVKPANPGLAHWYFGMQTSHVRTYRHAYVKAVHVNPQTEEVRVFFFDPTVLAAYELRRLTPRRTEKLIEATSRNDHYFVLKRYADDFVGRSLDPDAAFDEDVFSLESGDVTLLRLMSPAAE